MVTNERIAEIEAALNAHDEILRRMSPTREWRLEYKYNSDYILTLMPELLSEVKSLQAAPEIDFETEAKRIYSELIDSIHGINFRENDPQIIQTAKLKESLQDLASRILQAERAKQRTQLEQCLGKIEKEELTWAASGEPNGEVKISVVRSEIGKLLK